MAGAKKGPAKKASGGRKAPPAAVPEAVAQEAFNVNAEAARKKKYGVQKVGAWEKADDRVRALIAERRGTGHAVLAVIWVPADEIRPALMVATYTIEDEAQAAIIRKAANGGS